jgi:hypothetical protein
MTQQNDMNSGGDAGDSIESPTTYVFNPNTAIFSATHTLGGSDIDDYILLKYPNSNVPGSALIPYRLNIIPISWGDGVSQIRISVFNSALEQITTLDKALSRPSTTLAPFDVSACVVGCTIRIATDRPLTGAPMRYRVQVIAPRGIYLPFLAR